MTKVSNFFNNFKTFFLKEKNISARRKTYSSLWAIFFGIAIAFLLILFLGKNPFEVLNEFISGSFHPLRRTALWVNFSILGISGIAVGVGFKVGLFNIGVAGQMMLAGMLSVYYLLSRKDDISGIDYLVSILIAIVSGTFLALIAAFLKSMFNVHEVVTTILLNWIIVWIGKYVYSQGFEFTNTFGSGSIPIKSLVPFFDQSNFWIVGSLFTLILAIIIWVVFTKTTLGYKIKMTGINKDASKYAGVNEKVTIWTTLSFSGALAGIAGWIFYAINNKSYAALSVPIGIGFDGIAISLLAYNSPIGILFTSFFYSILQTGAPAVQTTGLSPDAISIVPALILYMAALATLFSRFRLMSYTRKYLFLWSQKKYWSKRKDFLLEKSKIRKSYKFNLSMARKTSLVNKQKIKKIKNDMIQKVDFKLLEKMTSEEKLEYYDKLQKEKYASHQELQTLGYFVPIDLRNKFKSDIFSLNNNYKIFINHLFKENKNSQKEWIYIPILKIQKMLFNKKGGK